uniref:Uncharacterized protein n=1 Tax=Steinernema glaseri TaxID=37863 RepID=A0A1I7XZ07_9BILA
MLPAVCSPMCEGRFGGEYLKNVITVWAAILTEFLLSFSVIVLFSACYNSVTPYPIGPFVLEACVTS